MGVVVAGTEFEVCSESAGMRDEPRGNGVGETADGDNETGMDSPSEIDIAVPEVGTPGTLLIPGALSVEDSRRCIFARTWATSNVDELRN